MIRNLKFLGFFLFFLLASVKLNPAQMLEENIFRKDSQTKSVGIKTDENITAKQTFSQRFFEKTPQKINVQPFVEQSKKQNLITLTNKLSSASPTDYELFRGDKEINFEFAYSPLEPTHFAGPKEYNTAGRKLGLAVFRWGKIIGTKKGITWEYLFEAIPFVISLKNEVKNPVFISTIATPSESPTKRETSFGFGITPAAFRLYFLRKSRLKPFLHFGAGMIFTNKPMPLPETTWYNFTGYWGGGIMYRTSQNRAITFSYKYFHISNFNVTDPNPGYNANVIALGYSFFYK